MKNRKINIYSNTKLYALRPFSSQKFYNNPHNTLKYTHKQLYNKININKIPIQTNKDIINSNEKYINNNNQCFDNLSEKVLNLYDFADTIKSEHDSEKYNFKIINKIPADYQNTFTRDPYTNYVRNKNKKININMNKNSLSGIVTNNPSFKKIFLNKRNNNISNISNISNTNPKIESAKKNRNIINYVSPKINNVTSHYDYNYYNNYLTENPKYKRNSKIMSNYKYVFKERNSYNLNKSPVGRFDNYFFDSNYSNYKLDKKKLLNNEIMMTNSIKKEMNKRLRIESPTSLSYHSYLRKKSPKEMSIEHNIEYDIHNFSNKNNLKFINVNQNESNRKETNNIPFNEKENEKFKLKTENNDLIRNKAKFDTNNNLNFNKLKSVTVSRLIKDLYSQNTDIDNNENNKSKELNKNDNLISYCNKTDDTKEINTNKSILNNNINNKKNQKRINVNKNINNKSTINKKIKKIIKNDIEIIIEYNNDNNIKRLILNDKKGRKINFIPNNIIYKKKNFNTIDNTPNSLNINKIKNDSLNSSISKKTKVLKNSINKKNKKDNRSSIKSSDIFTLYSKEKLLYNKLNTSPQNDGRCDNAIQSINISFKNSNNRNINKKRIPNNHNNKKI